jgi:hypothetical protein
MGYKTRDVDHRNSSQIMIITGSLWARRLRCNTAPCPALMSDTQIVTGGVGLAPHDTVCMIRPVGLSCVQDSMRGFV